MTENSFATAINCIDGRTVRPLNDYFKQEYNIKYVDLITEPGPDKVLSENQDQSIVQSIKRRVAISLVAHHSKTIAIVGHHECAANPSEAEEHIEQIKQSVTNLQKWGYEVTIIGLWINSDWQVQKVT